MEMQMLQMASKPQVTTMSLTKFSSATSSNGSNGPIPWSHLTSEDSLFASFEVSTDTVADSCSESYRFRVVNHPDVLVLDIPRHI